MKDGALPLGRACVADAAVGLQLIGHAISSTARTLRFCLIMLMHIATIISPFLIMVLSHRR